MPIPVLGEIYYNGISSVPYLIPALKVLPWVLLLVVLKTYFNGTKNGNERVMHGKVAIVTVCIPTFSPCFNVRSNTPEAKAPGATRVEHLG